MAADIFDLVDEKKGDIFDQVSYSPQNPPPAEIKPGTGAKAENVIARMDQTPTYPSKANETQGTVENLANAAGEIASGIPGFVAKLPLYALQGAKISQGTLSEKLDALKFAGGEAIPMGTQMAKDIESPLGSKESFRGFLQAGLMAAPGLEIAREGLQAKLAPLTGAKPEAPPVQAPAELPANVQAEVPIEAAAKPETPTVQEQVSRETGDVLSAIRSGGTNIPRYIELTDGSQHQVAAFQPVTFEGDIALSDGNTADVRTISKVLDENRNSIHEAQPVPEASQAPVGEGLQAKPELPENVEVTIKASTSKGEPLEVKMDAREAEKVLNERKTALENLIDCLG